MQCILLAVESWCSYLQHGHQLRLGYAHPVAVVAVHDVDDRVSVWVITSPVGPVDRREDERSIKERVVSVKMWCENRLTEQNWITLMITWSCTISQMNLICLFIPRLLGADRANSCLELISCSTLINFLSFTHSPGSCNLLLPPPTWYWSALPDPTPGTSGSCMWLSRRWSRWLWGEKVSKCSEDTEHEPDSNHHVVKTFPIQYITPYTYFEEDVIKNDAEMRLDILEFKHTIY